MMSLRILNAIRPIRPAFNQICFSSTNAAQSNRGDNQDLPVEMNNPFKKEKPQCILCKYQVEVNYKNPRLLSQFVSPYTGLPYDKHITGLCERQHQLVQHSIKKSIALGFLPKHFRNPQYEKDPKLFDPFRPSRPNPY